MLVKLKIVYDLVEFIILPSLFHWSASPSQNPMPVFHSSNAYSRLPMVFLSICMKAYFLICLDSFEMNFRLIKLLYHLFILFICFYNAMRHISCKCINIEWKQPTTTLWSSNNILNATFAWHRWDEKFLWLAKICC